MKKQRKPGRPRGSRDSTPRGPRVAGVTIWIRIPEEHAALIDALKPEFGSVSGVIRAVIADAVAAGWFKPQEVKP
jgi:hypothetical protein